VGINTPSSFIAYSWDTACARGVTAPRRPLAPRVFLRLPIRLVVVVVVVVAPETRAVIVREHHAMIPVARGPGCRAPSFHARASECPRDRVPRRIRARYP
jgi:hypothetical protein